MVSRADAYQRRHLWAGLPLAVLYKFADDQGTYLAAQITYYSRARDAMVAATDSAWAPWYIADADDKKRARLNIISHLLSQVPYKPLAHREIKLPKRQPPGGYVPPDLPLRHIPEQF
jgi:hypothetical protein